MFNLYLNCNSSNNTYDIQGQAINLRIYPDFYLMQIN